jgi:hypothetical protein
VSGDGEVSEETSPTDDELLEAAAGGEQGFEEADATGEIDVALLVAERDEFRDTMLRVKAEFDNYRKRVAREQEELRERLKQEMTPEEYQEWEWEQEDEYFDLGLRMETEFSLRASPAAMAYYGKHGLMLSDGDFVSSEWGAERKLDKVRREEKQKK